MLKKIQTDQLKPGMFIHELGGDWFSHPFLRNKFSCSESDIEKVRAAGIRELYIDTARGPDVAEGRIASEVAAEVESEMIQALSQERPPVKHTTLGEELAQAQKIHAAAHRVVRNVMQDFRLGKTVKLENIDAMVEDISESVLRNSGAMISLLRLKKADEYTFLHSVAVGTMMVTFAQARQLDRDWVRQCGIGGVLHDVGKMKIPDAVLNKPGRLTDDEFATMKGHSSLGYEMLVELGGVGPVPLDIARHHHERMDGTGYPDRAAADDISQSVRMAAIVDVYDAITSTRVYHAGMQPTEALRKMWEWSKFQFDQALLQSFMRSIGIYPVGSLVKLESGRLGVVVDQNEKSLLTPVVRVFFSSKAMAYIPPLLVDLSRGLGAGGGDKIVSHEIPEKWNLDPMRFLQCEY